MDLNDENGRKLTCANIAQRTKLKELTIADCLLSAEHLLNNCPNLAQFRLEYSKGILLLTPSIEKFLVRHRLTIKKLKLVHIDCFNLTTFEQMAALEVLEFFGRGPQFAQAGTTPIILRHPS